MEFVMFMGTPLRSGHLTHLKRNFSKFYIFLLSMYLVYQNLFCGTLVCDMATWLKKFECICSTGKSVTIFFPRSTDIIQVLNELPTDKRHKVPQDRLLCPTHVDNKIKTAFRKKSF